MPRKARLNVPGALYHVMSRCLPMYQLFSDDTDREYFLSLLSVGLFRSGCKCYAWVLMDNHYHIVLRSGEEDLWRLMKPLQMRYAQYHGRKTGRRGPLFMDRYKSIVTQDQHYLMELIRYVHLNPVRAGICRNLTELKRYRWSGHRNIMHGIRSGFQDVNNVLRRFGQNDADAIKQYAMFLQEGLVETPVEDELIRLVRNSNEGRESGRKVASWVIGDREFTAKVLSKAEANRLRISRFEHEGCDLSEIVGKVALYFKIPPEALQVRQRGGAASDARKVFAYVASRIYHTPAAKVREYLGIGAAAVSALGKAGEVINAKRKVFK
jgi:putative transposase